MDNNQIVIIKQYLQIETNYAVILNGEYGIGKTHFFKNCIIPAVEKIALPKNSKRSFIPIHISLFGIKSLEEVQTSIFMEIFPILKNKKLKLAIGIGKSIIRGIAEISGFGEIDNYLEDLNQDKNDWLKYDELLICFDDLDRKSDALDVRDLFGFINSLVENQGAKILIIANEKQLLKMENYSEILTEKVIGVTIQYKPNIEEIFQQIILERYSTVNKKYFEFLQKNCRDILQIVQINENNFRNLIFFFEHFKTIFCPLEKLFEEDKEFEILKTEKQKAVLDFTLAIAFEYKSGLLNSTNIEEVKSFTGNTFDITKFLLEDLDSKNKNEAVQTYIQIFNQKYFSQNRYLFFNSIFEYITGVKAFAIHNLRIEIEKHFVLKDGKIPEPQKLLQSLSFFDCLNLTDKEYRRLTNKMLLFVDQGKFELNQYHTAFQYSIRLNNLLNYDVPNLVIRFKKGVEKGRLTFKYDEHLYMEMSISNNIEFKKEVTEIIQYCLKLNESLKERKEEIKLKDLFNLFQKDFDRFLEKVNKTNSEFRFSPFWSQVDTTTIFNSIKKLKNANIWQLGNYFIHRYRNVFKDLSPEKIFVIELRKLIDKPTLKRKSKNLHNASLNYLSKCLKQCEGNFAEIE